MSKKPDVSLSVISHGQMGLVTQLLEDLQEYCSGGPLEIEVILTLNIFEEIQFRTGGFSFDIRIIRNLFPKGFGANHNSAFRVAEGKYFCVVNPDIRLVGDPFPALVKEILKGVGVVGPLVRNRQGGLEESARKYPTPFSIIKKALKWGQTPDYKVAGNCIKVDWIGGMFMLFANETFSKGNGFDERYFLYYEDVDLCARLSLQNYSVMLCPFASVVHEARRSSHRNAIYARWHLCSMIRFFFSRVLWIMVIRDFCRVLHR